MEFSDPPEHLTYPLVFPIKDWPKKNDPAFIGMFFSKCRIGKLRENDLDRRKPGVYFRYAYRVRKLAHYSGHFCYILVHGFLKVEKIYEK